MLYTVRFQQENSDSARSVDVPDGTPLHEAAIDAGLPIRSNCGGRGTCRKCVVLVDEKEQLACQTVVDGNLEIVVPKSSLKDDALVVQDRSFHRPQDDILVNGRKNHRFGAAVDIGTTTLALELFDLSSSEARFSGVVSRTNPQRNYGDDVISRIQKIIEDPGSLGLMQSLIVGAVDEMLDEAARTAGIEPSEISIMSVAGNTVMEHIFLGIDPSPLGFAPFTPPVTDFPNCRGGEIGLNAAPDCLIETMPIFGGFVGGDIVAGVVATEIHRSMGTSFLIDIGTNGELALFHDGRLYTAAAAAGPAFEGGRIEYGMTAVAGAIDKATFREDGTVTISTIGDRRAMGLCGSGLIDVASEMLRYGLIAPNGRFNIKPDSPFLNRWKIVDDTPAFELVPVGESARNEAILLTQRDVRQLQLAAGAIRAGIVLLLRQQGSAPGDIETFYVAGGFGSFIRPESARRIGLLPKEIPLERIRFCGNTALAGARLALIDPRYREEGLEQARRACHVELASQPDFAMVFAESMIF